MIICMKLAYQYMAIFINFPPTLTLSSLTLHCHLHPLQAANRCRNSRLVVDEHDLLWVKK